MGSLRKVGNDSICKITIRWAHIQKDEKTGDFPPVPKQNNVRCKIFFAPLCFYSERGSEVWFDQFIGVDNGDNIIFAMSVRRFEKETDGKQILEHVIPRIPDYATRDFVMAYAYGVNVIVDAVVPVNANPLELKYSME